MTAIDIVFIDNICIIYLNYLSQCAFSATCWSNLYQKHLIDIKLVDNIGIDIIFIDIQRFFLFFFA